MQSWNQNPRVVRWECDQINEMLSGIFSVTILSCYISGIKKHVTLKLLYDSLNYDVEFWKQRINWEVNSWWGQPHCNPRRSKEQPAWWKGTSCSKQDKGNRWECRRERYSPCAYFRWWFCSTPISSPWNHTWREAQNNQSISFQWSHHSWA